MLNNRILISTLLLVVVGLNSLVNGFNWGFSALKSSNSIDDDRSSRSYKIVCYYTNWAQYRPKPGAFFPENVDPKLCTHIIFAFAKLNDAYELQSFEWNDESTEWSKGMYERVVQLKQLNKDLKVLIAVGGWNHGSLPFSNMVSDSTRRSNFVAKTVEFLKKNNFDGLDLDWEYPANRDTENRPDDKIYFTILCKDLYAAFRPHGYILTAAVAAGIKYMHSAYEIGEIHKYLSFINLMAYDLHGAWENVTGHNAPLYKHAFDKDPTLNLDFAVSAWLEGVPSDKLVLGLATYGRSFQLKEGFESCPLTDTPVSKAGTSGKYSREDGFLTYYEVCDKLLVNNWNYVWNDQQKVPYAYSNELFSSTSGPLEWVGFDDVRSIEVKSKYIMDRKLGGAMIWSLDMDDFTGTFCNQGKYPLLSTVNYYLNPGGSVQSVPVENRIRKSVTTDSDSSKAPKTEYDFFKEFSERKAAQGSFNVFNLIQNDVMQVYKYCQCKNGTHKINADHNDDAQKPDDRYTYIVDCNRKRVYPAASYVDTTSTTTTTLNEPGDNDRTNIWTIFNSNSAVNVFNSPTSTLISDTGTRNNKKIVCYISSFHQRKSENATLRAENIDPFMCTHLIYSMAKIDEKTYDRLVPLDVADLDYYKKLTELKNKNKKLKVLLSIGSFRDGTTPFVKIFNNNQKRRDFVRNVVLYLKNSNFDGLEINWNIRNIDQFLYSNQTDFVTFMMMKFIQQLSNAFKPHKLVLTAMVSGLNEVVQKSYDMINMNKYLDFITIMMYDFYEIPLKLKQATHHNPLYTQQQDDITTMTQQSVNNSVNLWLKALSRDKIVVGVELHARTYKLFKQLPRSNLNSAALGSTVKKEGTPGEYSQINGILSYFEMCSRFGRDGWTYGWMDIERVPYLYDRHETIAFYEDPDSIEAKALYVNSNNIGGIGLFSLDMDDFSGLFCHQGVFPLVNTARDVFERESFIQSVSKLTDF